jgi:hypothetical protein
MKKFLSLVLVALIFTTSNVFASNNNNTVNSNQNNQPIQNSIQYQNATIQILQNQQQFLHNNEALQKQLNEANQNFQELIDSQR